MQRLVIALVTLLGLAAGTFVAAYFVVFSAAVDRAASVAPAGSAFYVNVYLQPSTGQQLNLSGLIGRLPGFADASSLDSKIDQIVENLLSGTGINYGTQIKPWLGDQVALAGWADGEDPVPLAVVIAAVKDRPAAEAAVEELVAAGAMSFRTEAYAGVDLHVAEGSAYAFVDDLLVVGESVTAIQSVVDVSTGAASLADRADFRDAMARVPADHLASAFVDLGAIATATGTGDQFGSFTSASAALVAEPDGLRLSGSAPFDVAAAAESAADRFAMGTEPSSLVEWMPEGTVAEAVVFGLRQTLEDAEAVIGGTGEGDEVLGMLDTLRALAAFGLGIDIDTDLLPLLDREVGIAVTGIDGEMPSGQLLLRPDDAEAAAAALAQLGDRLSSLGGTTRTETIDATDVTIIGIPDTGEVAYAIADGIIILGFSTDDVMAAITAHATGDSLAGTDAYQRTFEIAGTRAGTEVFVNLGALDAPGLLEGAGAELPGDARDILAQLGAFGLTVPSHDDQIDFHAVLTVTDRRAE